MAFQVFDQPGRIAFTPLEVARLLGFTRTQAGPRAPWIVKASHLLAWLRERLVPAVGGAA